MGVILDGCYFGWVLFWMGVILDGCYFGWVLFRMGVISDGCYFGWVLFRMGVISDGCYFGWALFRTGVISDGCYQGLLQYNMYKAYTSSCVLTEKHITSHAYTRAKCLYSITPWQCVISQRKLISTVLHTCWTINDMRVYWLMAERLTLNVGINTLVVLLLGNCWESTSSYKQHQKARPGCSVLLRTVPLLPPRVNSCVLVIERASMPCWPLQFLYSLPRRPHGYSEYRSHVFLDTSLDLPLHCTSTLVSGTRISSTCPCGPFTTLQLPAVACFPPYFKVMLQSITVCDHLHSVR